MKYLLLSLVALSLKSISCNLYDGESDVVELTTSNFKKTVVESETFWIVKFYAPWCGHCKSMAEDYSNLAKSLKGMIKVGSINVDKESSLGEKYGIKGFPTVKFFLGDKQSPIDYSGTRTADAMLKKALQEIEKEANKLLKPKSKDSQPGEPEMDGDIIVLTDDNFEEALKNSDETWLVKFYAPWCGHCKAMAQDYADAATKLKGKVKLAKVDATQNSALVTKYGIKGFPTLKVFMKGSAMSPREYDGGRSSSDIISWMEGNLKFEVDPVNLFQVTSNEIYENECLEKKVCLFAFLPMLEDTTEKERHESLEMFKDVAKKSNSAKWGWVWTVGAEHLKYEEALNIDGLTYPFVIALRKDKKIFSVMKTSFTKQNFNEFIHQIKRGKIIYNDIPNDVLKLKEISGWKNPFVNDEL